MCWCNGDGSYHTADMEQCWLDAAAGVVGGQLLLQTADGRQWSDTVIGSRSPAPVLSCVQHDLLSQRVAAASALLAWQPDQWCCCVGVCPSSWSRVERVSSVRWRAEALKGPKGGRPPISCCCVFVQCTSCVAAVYRERVRVMAEQLEWIRTHWLVELHPPKRPLFCYTQFLLDRPHSHIPDVRVPPHHQTSSSTSTLQPSLRHPASPHRTSPALMPALAVRSLPLSPGPSINMTVPSVPPEAALSVNVHIHEWSATLYIGEARQSFAWLAHLASHLYATHCYTTRAATHHLHSLTPLVPLNITDSDDNHYLPAWPLYEHITHLQHLYVTTQPAATPLAPPTHLPMFHHLSTASPAHHLPLSLHFDMNRIPTYRASSSREIDPPCLVTSLTGWRQPIPMRLGKSGVYRVALHVPLHATVCFVFLVGGKVVLSDEYATGKDQYGQRLHIVTVSPPPPSYPPLTSAFPPPATLRVSPIDPQLPAVGWKRPFAERGSAASFDAAVLVTERDEEDEEMVWPLAVTGHLQPSLPSLLAALSFITMSAHKDSAVNAVQSPLQLRVLDTDFAHMHLTDVLDSSDKHSLMKETLCKHHLLLRAVYASYNTQPLPVTRGMTRCEWLAFCRICRIPDKRVTVQRLNRIFSITLKEDDVVVDDDDTSGSGSSTDLQAFGVTSQFSTDSSLYAAGGCLPVSAFFSCLIRTAALKFKQLSASPHSALESLLSRHIIPYASLYHLPSSHLRDTHHRQVSSVSSQSTQEREREKERSKEKLLYAAMLDGSVQTILQRHEEELYQLYNAIHEQPQPNADASAANKSSKPNHPLSLTEAEEVAGLRVDPLLVSSVALEQMRQELSSRRWWSSGDAEVLVDCWQDESMDEKQSEKEKEIEREKAAERETQGSRDERPVCLYRQCYAEWLLFVCKLADRWRLKRVGSEQQKANKAAAEADKLTDGGQSSREEAKEQLQAGQQAADDEERRREEEEQAARLAEKERLDELLYHRMLPQHLTAFLQQLFPSVEERARLRAEEQREEREKEEKEAAAKAAVAAAEKAEKAAKAKKSKEAAADSKEAAGKGGDKAAAGKKK